MQSHGMLTQKVPPSDRDQFDDDNEGNSTNLQAPGQRPPPGRQGEGYKPSQQKPIGLIRGRTAKYRNRNRTMGPTNQNGKPIMTSNIALINKSKDRLLHDQRIDMTFIS